MSSPSQLRVLVLCSVRWFNACAGYAADVSLGLRERGHDVRLVVKPDSPLETVARERGFLVLPTPDLTALGPDRVFQALGSLRREIERFDPHVVNCHRSEDHVLAAMALRRSGRPLIRTRGDVRPPRRHLANRFLYRRATRLHIGAADFMPDRFYAPLGVPRDRVLVIRPGIDMDDFAAGTPTREAARDRLGLPDDGPWIGQVGRLTRNKGHSSLVRALAGVSITPPPRLIISGEEYDVASSDIRELAGSLGVGDRVHLLPRVDDVRGILAALDVLAIPSIASEAIARIALEGLAMGVPAVGTAINSIPEILGDAGLVVAPGDPRELAAALERMLSNTDLRSRAATEGPARIRQRYDRSQQIALTEQAFYRALNGEPA